MGNNVAGGTSLTFFAANAGAYATTNSALTAARESVSNREQECTIGSKIFGVTFDITIQPDTTGTAAGGAIEYVVFKIERSPVVPSDAINEGLPNDTDVGTLGLQAAFRRLQPGRVIKFGNIPFTEQITAVRTIHGSYGKFKMSTIRTGDWYGIMMHVRAANGPLISIQARYKECI